MTAREFFAQMVALKREDYKIVISGEFYKDRLDCISFYINDETRTITIGDEA